MEVSRVACYDKIYECDPAPAPWDRSTPQDSIHLERGNIPLCSQFLMFQSHSVPLSVENQLPIYQTEPSTTSPRKP
jgi:hypothetical protein